MIARQRQTYGEEVANVLTHGAGMLLGLTAIVVLMMAAIRSGNPWAVGSFAVYAVCMTLSYVTSTFYHASTHARQKRLLRRFDHSAIYLHIAGTYTPFTLLGVWLSFRKMKKKDHLKTVCYLAMGWVVIIAFKPLLHVFRETGSMDVLYWLIGGGLFYTVGSLFFFLDKYKYMHPVWHFFVLGGSVCDLPVGIKEKGESNCRFLLFLIIYILPDVLSCISVPGRKGSQSLLC